jgi:hypothetical protein
MATGTKLKAAIALLKSPFRSCQFLKQKSNLDIIFCFFTYDTYEEYSC